jgi:serine/threonine-protein kinase
MTLPDARPGEHLGPYRLDRPLGRGGMGAVFLAHHTALHRRVALKVLFPSSSDRRAHEQLLHEARNAAALNHPGICTVYEVGEAAGRAFMAMEYVDGLSIAARLRGLPLPGEEALAWASEIADALAYAHDHGVVHRDLKAANVIITADRRVKLVDFGLARRDDPLLAPADTMSTLATPGAATGTPYAMAPEQIRGAATDARTDVWAFGVLLHEMVTGTRPFAGDSIPELFSAILRDPPPPVPEHVREPVRATIARCLDKSPDRRYRNGRDLLVALDARASGASALRGSLAAGRTEAAATSRITILILPFANLSGDAEHEYFCDGFTDETISAVGAMGLDRLRVVARTSSMVYKQTTKTVAQIASEVRADYMLESSVRREAPRVRIASRLIRVHDECQVWSEVFTRTTSSVLGVQDEVSHAIANAIQSALALPPRAIQARPTTGDPVAYDLALRGRYHWFHFALADAIQSFRAAIDRDPSYALAHAGLAEVFAGMPIQADADPTVYWQKAREAAATALSLAPDLAEAHAAAGWVDFFLGWDWPRAIQGCRRAIELNPNYALAYFYLAHALSNGGRHDEAIALIRKGKELDPLAPVMYSFHAQFLFDARRYAEAVEVARGAIAMAPGFFHGHEILSRLLLQLGEHDAALVECDQAQQLAGGMLFAFARRGHVLGMMGRRADAEAVLNDLHRTAARRFVSPSHFAMVHAGLGRREQALGCLEAAFDVRAVQLSLLPTDPMWDDYRDEPRFRAMLRRLNLP